MKNKFLFVFSLLFFCMSILFSSNDRQRIFRVVEHHDFSATMNLIKKGIDLNITDKNGKTPLYYTLGMYPRYKKSLDMIRLLIKNGAEINITDKKGNSPLDIAIKFNNKKIIKILKKHGARRGHNK